MRWQETFWIRGSGIMYVKLFTDGAARGNPDGPGGYGSILQYVDKNGTLHEREFSAGYKKTTNNRMELMAVIVGLEALTKPCDVEVISDSKYVTDAFNQHWVEGWLKRNWKNSAKQDVKNIDLWQRLLKAKAPHNVMFTWVKGHAGHPENERCDNLATSAADNSDINMLLDDTVGEVLL
jgi:ribonuclease HI